MASTGGSSKPKNFVIDPMAIFAEFSARGKGACSIHINLDGEVAVSCLDIFGATGQMTAVAPKPTFTMMAEELHNFLVKESVEACIVGLVTDKHVSQFVGRFANRLNETGKLKDVKYTLYKIPVSYESLTATSSKNLGYDSMSDPSGARKRLGHLKNWRVPPFFDDEICALSKPTFTLDIALNGGIQVAGSCLEAEAVIPPKPTFDMMAEALHKLISEYSVEGCIVGIVSDVKVADFVEVFAHRLFQTGKLKDIRYTFHTVGKKA